MSKTNRKWEMWDDKNVERLAGSWSNPASLPSGSFVEDGSHWSLIQRIYALTEGESVLDVGCGMGHLFALVKDKFDYLGIDTSQPMLKKAQDFFPENEDKFKLGDAYDLSALPEFDTVVAVGLILHLPDSERVIKQLWNQARICIVFSAWIGETPLKRKVPMSFKNRILRKHFIQRRETVQRLRGIFNRLPDLDRVEQIPFPNPDPGESNYIFKLGKYSSTAIL